MSKSKRDPDAGLGIDFRQFGGTMFVQGNGQEVWDFGWPGEQFAAAELPKAIERIETLQQHPARWEDVFRPDGSDPDGDIFLWDNERIIRGSVQKSWNQGQVGSCVSFGWGRGANDLMLYQAANGEIDAPEFDIATEPIYGGSRVEVGGGRLGSSDGSLGSWAADWCLKWGMLLRTVYGSYNLTTYSQNLCRQWGTRGVPDELEPIAKQFPIKSVALITSADQAWEALGTNKPIPICSNRGFDSPLDEGFCEPRGTWNHCMVVRARFMHAKGRCFVIQNSWADYLRSHNNPDSILTTKNGTKVQLPEGCFASTASVLDGILRQRDSYVISDARGFKERNRYRW